MVLIDSARQMYIPSIAFQDAIITPMNAAIQVCESMLRQKVSHVAISKIGKRDGIGVMLYGQKEIAQESDEDDVESDIEESPTEHLSSKNAPFKVILSLAPPGIQQLKNMRACLVGSTLSHDLQKYCPDDDYDDSSRPLRSALHEASKIFASAKCVKRKTLSDKSKPDSKNLWIFTCRDTPCQNLEEERQHLLIAAKDAQDNGIDIQVWPFSNEFDASIFYKEILSAPPPDDFSFGEMLENMQQQWNKIRKVMSIPLLMQNHLPDCPGIMLDFFRTVVPQRRPMPVWITQTTKKMTEKVTQVIAMETGEILRTTGSSEPSKPIPSDLIFTYTEFGGERVPLTPTDIADIKRASNSGQEIASVALRGFKPMSALPITHILEKSFFCYPNDNAIKGSTEAFANLHGSMLRKQVVLIGELLTRVTATSRLVALIPQSEGKDSDGDQVLAPGMIVITLPFEDDVRGMEIDAEGIMTSELLEQAKGLIRGQKLSSVEFGANFENAALKRFWTYIESVALGTNLQDREHYDTDIDDDRLRAMLGENIAGFLNELPDDMMESREKVGSRKRKVLEADESGCDWVQLYTTNSLPECKVDELKQYLRSVGARVSGKKDELVLRVSQSIGDRVGKGEL